MKKSQASLEWHEGEKIMTEFSFLGDPIKLNICSPRAAKWLIAINRIQNKSFLFAYYMCVSCIYKYTHIYVYILKNICMHV